MSEPGSVRISSNRKIQICVKFYLLLYIFKGQRFNEFWFLISWRKGESNTFHLPQESASKRNTRSLSPPISSSDSLAIMHEAASFVSKA